MVIIMNEHERKFNETFVQAHLPEDCVPPKLKVGEVYICPACGTKWIG